MARMRGQGGALVKHEKGSIIPSRNEIIKDLVKYFFTEYGLDVAEKLFEPISLDKLKAMWLEKRAQKQLAAKSGGGGAMLLVLAALAFSGRKRKR